MTRETLCCIVSVVTKLGLAFVLTEEATFAVQILQFFRYHEKRLLIHTLDSWDVRWVRQIPFNYDFYIIEQGKLNWGKDVVGDSLLKYNAGVCREGGQCCDECRSVVLTR